MKRGAFALAAWLVLAAATAAGAEVPSTADKVWIDEAELSFANATGNTRTTSLAGKNLLTCKFAPEWLGSWKIGGLYSADNGQTTAESYASELRTDYLHTERIYGYALGGWNKDRFAGIDQRYYGGAGAGYRLLLGPGHLLAAEGGLNYTVEDYTDGTGSDFLTGRAFAKCEYAFSKKSRFSQSPEYLQDLSELSHFRVNSETALVAALNATFSLKAGYTVRYDHKPVPADLKTTDTVMAVAPVANF